MTVVVVLGGARSGKSQVAERRVAALAGTGPVTYVATAMVGSAADPHLAERVARHRARRPASWTTVDARTDLADQLTELTGPVLLDSLGPWVGARMDEEIDHRQLAERLARRSGDTVVVSDEVGLAVHPPTAAGRRFTDLLGTVNQAVVAVADEAWLVVAGRLVRLDPEPDWSEGPPR